MNRIVLTLAVLPLIHTSCIFAIEGQEPKVPEPIGYVENDSPENVLQNLASAHTNRDIDAYSEIFAPEFRFRFQEMPDTPAGCTADNWNREVELEGARNLFSSAQVKMVSVLVEAPPAMPSSEEGMEGMMLIRTATIDLSITRMDQVTYSTLGDLHEFFFRSSREDEEPGRWFLVEWRDHGTPSAPAVDEGTPTPISHLSWWALKCSFNDP